MEFEYLILFAGLAMGATSVYLFCSIVFTRNTDSESLAWAEGNEPAPSQMPLIQISRPLVHNLTLQHVKRIKSPSYRASIEKKLLTTGLSRELNTDEFIGLQILWGIMFPVFFVIINFALQFGYPYWLAIGISVFGIYFPHLYCSSQKKKRYSSVVAELPFVVDLLSLSTEAGLDFFGALQKITDKSQSSVLSDELLVVQKDIRLGSSRKEALENLTKRLDIAEITSVCAVIIDADETGASVSKTLKSKSRQMRFERFVRAEQAGAKASQKMLIPMITLTLPAVLITLFAPIALQFFYGGGV